MCILSFTACLLKPQSILNFQGCFAFVSKSIPLVIFCLFYKSVASESVSHSTLLTAFSKADLQSDNLEAQEPDNFLCWNSVPSNTTLPNLNIVKMGEKWWMWNIGARHPIGINQIYLIKCSINVPAHSRHYSYFPKSDR